MKFIALNDKTESSFATKIVTAIIINFIYYRHSLLNVCLPLFQPNASHSVFFTFFQTHPADLCYCLKLSRLFTTLPCSTVRKTLANNFLIFSAKHL
ncbi:hypothetical protein D5703_18870 [Salmonella enterica]|uniref:Uncharacterized protein n=3 Tax=Salmonella enterica TaxID=28901 RepID=A0A3T3ER75_SALMU|nr:hypothetical protein CGA23_12745 [Salmonella enterica subsp. enterica]AXD32793.1 hypothetical protein CHD15_08160 [Salmonella enterica]EAA0603359.1 hypothetical protein [Salmonella enterica subsp. enterica serovar Muenchen]EAC0331794.1 hypothetical protein [Salmonella enterica subsp. enterica serovar Karamoja]EBS3997290.1 hypothetical protein [Salmonella enterica subsp. enterica serovar Matopeni]EBY7413230.1 hypothetical protein [Salmonella enterica subsp. enterica serovar Alachua]ECH81828